MKNICLIVLIFNLDAWILQRSSLDDESIWKNKSPFVIMPGS